MSTPSDGKPGSSRSMVGSPSPKAEYPFPGHDWSARSPRPPARRFSNASTVSISSVAGSLDGAVNKRRNTVAETGQNAISTLLQPPIVRTGLLPHTAIHSSSHKPPTARDIPPVTLTNIPHIEPSAFNDYLSQVGSLFTAFQRMKLDPESGGSQLFRQDASNAKDDDYTQLVEREKRRDSNASISSQRTFTSGLLSPVETPGGRRRVSGLKRGQLAPTPLSTIPSVYFDDNFHLENPRTFDVVSEHAEVVRQLRPADDGTKGANGTVNGDLQPARKALTTNAILQEKLSWYMDTVEIHLISSISQASASFFAALGSLHELQAEAADSIAKIQKLREDLAYLDKEIVVGGLEIISMKRKRDNLQKLCEAAEQLQHVLSGANYCEDLVDSGQLETAILHISYVEQLSSGILDPSINGDLPWLPSKPSIRLIDLRRLNALGGLSQGISQLRLRIGKGYETRLLEILLGDLRRHVESVPPRDTLARWTSAANRARGVTDTPSSTPAYMMTTEKLREELIPVLQGLGQSQYLATASTTFREAVIREMKSLIRQHLPSSTDDDNESVTSVSTRASGRRATQQEKSSTLARNLRALTPEDAEAFFVQVYCGIGEALRRLGVQVKVLLDVTSGMKKPPTSAPALVQSPGRTSNPTIRSPSPSTGHSLQEELTQALDMSSLLGQAVDKAQSETTKVLRVRNEQTVHLRLIDFLRYFTLNRLFTDECEAVSGRSGAALKGVVNNQIHDFVPLLHETEKRKLAQKMESDAWEPIDFQGEDATILTRIVQSMTSDPPTWLSYTDASAAGLEGGDQTPHTNGASAAPTDTTKINKKNPTPAEIDGEKIILVDSAAFALRGLEQYMILLVSVPNMAGDISTVLLDYLKLFNSRAQQLILGAGAKRTAGLANINTKHLALASQSLSFFIALIPYLRECIRRRPSITGTGMAEYDRVKRMFQDHQSFIHEKVIEIMNIRATVCTRAMEGIEWDSEEEVQRSSSPHMETLTKETLTLQRVLSKYLPALSVRMIVKPVFMSYEEQLSKAFNAAAVRTEAGQARLLRDAELLDSKLGKIDGAEGLGAHIISLVKAKQVVSPPKPNTSVPPDKETPAPAAPNANEASASESTAGETQAEG